MRSSGPHGASPRVGVVMGSISDWATLKHASDTLAELAVRDPVLRARLAARRDDDAARVAAAVLE